MRAGGARRGAVGLATALTLGALLSGCQLPDVGMSPGLSQAAAETSAAPGTAAPGTTAAPSTTAVTEAAPVTPARVAGDEFCVVLDGMADRAQAAGVAEELRDRLEQGLDGQGVGVSLGLALGPEDGDDPAALLRAADAAMYADKVARSRARTRSAAEGG